MKQVVFYPDETFSIDGAFVRATPQLRKRYQIPEIKHRSDIKQFIGNVCVVIIGETGGAKTECFTGDLNPHKKFCKCGKPILLKHQPKYGYNWRNYKDQISCSVRCARLGWKKKKA